MNLSDNSLGEEIDEFKEIMAKLASLASDNQKLTPLLGIVGSILAIVLLKPLLKRYISHKKKKNSKESPATTTSTET